jgi:hypothetical protein
MAKRKREISIPTCDICQGPLADGPTAMLLGRCLMPVRPYVQRQPGAACSQTALMAACKED